MARGDNRCSVCCIQECTCTSLGLNHHKPHLFAESHWQGRPNVVYVLYRFIVAVYMFVWLVISWTGKRNNPYWFIYLTFWSFLVLNVRLVLQACVALVHYIRHNVQDTAYPQRLHWALKMEWVLYNISSGAAIVVSFLFWVFLYLPDPGAFTPDLVSIHAHGVNAMLVLLDIWIAAIPLRALHFLHPFIYTSIYYIFNSVYILAGGTNEKGEPYIYPAFNWRTHPKQTAIQISVALAVCVAGWVLMWLMSRLARYLGTHCCSKCTCREQTGDATATKEVDDQEVDDGGQGVRISTHL